MGISIILKKIALVTGATGFIGTVLTRFLIDHGYQVRILARRPPSSDTIPRSAQLYFGDINDCQTLDEAITGTDVVFHLAAKLHVSSSEQTLKAEFKRVNVEGTRRLVAAARSAEVGRLVFFSTINVYGSSEPGLFCDEDSPIHPDSLYSQTKAQAEKIILEELPSVVLRLAAVYGPQMKGNYRRLLNALQKGYFFTVGHGLNRRTLVYIHDVCQAAILAAEHPDALGRIYNVTDGYIHTMQEVLTAMCTALGKNRPRFSLPAGIARTVFGVLEDLFRLFGHKSPIGRWAVDKLIEDLAVSGDRMQRELGFIPQYDLIKGWEDCCK